MIREQMFLSFCVEYGTKQTLKAKSLGSFLRLWGDFAGKNSGAEIEGESLELVDVSGKYWWTKSEENKRIWRKLAENLFGK